MILPVCGNCIYFSRGANIQLGQRVDGRCSIDDWEIFDESKQ